MTPNFAETLIAKMPDALIYADRDGVIQFWNAAATRLFGHTAQDAIGQSLDLIIPASLRERHWAGFRETMRSGRTRYGEGQMLSVPGVTKDGKRISIAFTITPFTDTSGEMTGIAAIMRDVTAQFEETRSLKKAIATLQATAKPDNPLTEGRGHDAHN